MSPNQNPVIVELKPKRNLLDPNFNGYKLSLDKLSRSVITIKSGVDRTQPSQQQYSLQHVKQFAMHNHIFSDAYNPFVVYIVDNAWAVLRVNIDILTGRLDVICEVWKIPNSSSREEGRFNTTISFADQNHAIVSDGCGTLYVVKTGDRKSSEPWNNILTFSPFTGKSSPQFCILDSSNYKEGNEAFIDVLALRIDDKNEWNDVLEKLQDSALIKQTFLTVIEWFTFQGEGTEETKWAFKSRRTLLGHSGMDYAYLESGGAGMYLASDSKFHMVFDSEKDITFQSARTNQNSEQSKKSEYLWTQTMEEVKLWFKVPFAVNKKDLSVDIKKTSISISYKNRIVLEGPLTKSVNIEGSYWIIDTPKCLPENAPEINELEESGSGDSAESKRFKVLEILLEKDEPDVVWAAELVKGNTCGEEIPDQELLEAIHSRLAHLCSEKWGVDPGQSDAYDPRELEDCDEFPSDTSCFMRIDRNLQRISHVASLGSHQWIFNVKLEPNKPPGICVRHDVDGLVWKPNLVSRPPKVAEITQENLIWECQHVNTFSAIGYVQASKQQRKYTVCSSDISYVAICDIRKHIYIYRQPTKIESCLRNRKTGEQVTHVAKQLVISLDPPHDVLGAYATPSYLYVLTPENFHAIRILADEE